MLIVPFCIEVTFSGVYGDRPWANVQHLEWDESSGGRTAGRLGNIGLAMTAAWVNYLATAMNENMLLTNTKVQDLDSASSFSVDTPGGGPGARTATGMPANVAVLATKVDGHSRSQRPGRAFWCGVCEADTDGANPSQLSTTGAALWQGVVDNYYAHISGTEGGSHWGPVVLHKSGADLVPYGMTGLDVETILATQRRRLRR